jgi:hypothetical protein
MKSLSLLVYYKKKVRVTFFFRFASLPFVRRRPSYVAPSAPPVRFKKHRTLHPNSVSSRPLCPRRRTPLRPRPSIHPRPPIRAVPAARPRLPIRALPADPRRPPRRPSIPCRRSAPSPAAVGVATAPPRTRTSPGSLLRRHRRRRSAPSPAVGSIATAPLLPDHSSTLLGRSNELTTGALAKSCRLPCSSSLLPRLGTPGNQK